MSPAGVITSETVGFTILGGSGNLGGTWLEEVGYLEVWTPPISCLPRVPGLSPSSLSWLPVFLKMETHPCHKLLSHAVQVPWTKLAETRNLNKPLQVVFKLATRKTAQTATYCVVHTRGLVTAAWMTAVVYCIDGEPRWEVHAAMCKRHTPAAKLDSHHSLGSHRGEDSSLLCLHLIPQPRVPSCLLCV